ncbi:cytochrome c oxidase assembly protein COX19-like [Pecten maximus]|uniref:LOW QUALITY PROTEIN: cytochrome c oxidase assembly protein COX19-like n=1 Tax=Pecten maximus TaxID=6579 RepID=UPI0014582E1C|nr:LOW QUALITY PROTEIN: cytochrome c oxidase assembly protein COX19-like [Pecten maximus]XP_033733176.1 cytochrome c oxidase assembly protein COX19-like [Pecten maximus]
MATPARRLNVRPPDKGSFPLDHEGECKTVMMKYMSCLKTHKQENDKCRIQAKDYLECRMNKNLMAKENWSKLGYRDMDDTSTETVSEKS